MKKFGIFLAVAVALFLAYVGWNYFFNPGEPSGGPAWNYKALRSSNDNRSIPETILDFGGKSVENVKSFATGIPQVAGDFISRLVDGAKDVTKEKLINILETSSSPPLAVSGNSAGSGTAGGAPRDSSAELRVCFVISKGETITYGIDQPFADARESSYKVDWGDGKTANGIFPGDQSAVISHSYVRQGIYTIVFQIANGSTTLTASRPVCVR